MAQGHSSIDVAYFTTWCTYANYQKLRVEQKYNEKQKWKKQNGERYLMSGKE